MEHLKICKMNMKSKQECLNTAIVVSKADNGVGDSLQRSMFFFQNQIRMTD
jgi:hypothetical protein